METIKNLLNRLRHMGLLLLIGFFLIIYIALGFLYFQQGAKQKDLEQQITQLSVVVSNPPPNSEKVRAEYDEANIALAPVPRKTAIAKLVDIARESGIDVDSEDGRFFNIPPAPDETVERKVSEGSYQVLSFTNVRVQGDYGSVMAFISALESGETLKTLVLKKVNISPIEVKYEDEEETRRTEFRNLSSAVIDMMAANNINTILNPANYTGGTGINDMTAFPDSTTTAAAKGYTGTGTPNPGYVLYQHDLINPDDTTTYTTVNYATMTETTYYYTCETDGTIRQFDGADIAAATEYLSSEEGKTETVAIIDVDLYTKLEG